MKYRQYSAQPPPSYQAVFLSTKMTESRIPRTPLRFPFLSCSYTRHCMEAEVFIFRPRESRTVSITALLNIYYIVHGCLTPALGVEAIRMSGVEYMILGMSSMTIKGYDLRRGARQEYTEKREKKRIEKHPYIITPPVHACCAAAKIRTETLRDRDAYPYPNASRINSYHRQTHRSKVTPSENTKPHYTSSPTNPHFLHPPLSPHPPFPIVPPRLLSLSLCNSPLNRSFSTLPSSSLFLAPLLSNNLASLSAFNLLSSSFNRKIQRCSLGARGPVRWLV